MADDTPPTAPESLPGYLAEGLPKQDDATLEDTREYIDALLAARRQPVADEDLPETAEPAEVENESGKGTLVEEYVTCGDEACACMTGSEKHGPYLYRYYREGGNLTSEYVGKP
jgi:hypothetical protein